MTNPVFLATELRAAETDGASCHLSDLAIGESAWLTGAEGHHAARVRRVRPGEAIELVDGSGLRLNAHCQANNGKAIGFLVADSRRERPQKSFVTLVQALAKGGRDEAGIEAATELGIDQIIPWQADRSVSRWSGAKARRGQERWQAIVTAAAKQSRRAFFPTVANLVNTRELVALFEKAGGDLATDAPSPDSAPTPDTGPTRPGKGATMLGPDPLLLVLHETATTPINDVLAAHLAEPKLAPSSKREPCAAKETDGNGKAPAAEEGADTGEAATATQPRRGIVLVIGPEGGINETELAALTAAGGHPVRLGPHVLRTSTAGPAALAVLGAAHLWEIND